MSIPTRLGRRSFLMGAGGAALVIPTLHSLFPAVAGANVGDGVRRNFISWRIGNGMFGHQWFPSAAAVSGASSIGPNARELPLADIAGPISPLLDASFDPFRSRMNLLRHIDRLDQADHTEGTALWGWSLLDYDTSRTMPSIDNIIADNAFDIPSIPLNITHDWRESPASCSVRTTADGSPIPQPGLRPAQAFQSLFANFTPEGQVDEVAARQLEQKVLLVDRAVEHYNAVRNHPRLSAADRARLDEHLEHMYSLENQLSLGSADCTVPEEPAALAMTPENVNASSQAVIDIAVAALRCELTQVVNINLDPDTMFRHALHGVEEHHETSHRSGPADIEGIFAAHRWHMGYLTDLLTKLDVGEDAINGGTILDNSLLLVSNEIGNQNGQSGVDPTDIDLNHGAMDNQVLLIGSCGGRLRTGNYLDYRTDHTRNRWSQYIGTSYNWVLVSCMLAMGLEPDAWERDGEPGFGDMRGQPFDMTPLDQVVVGNLRTYLPGLEA